MSQRGGADDEEVRRRGNLRSRCNRHSDCEGPCRGDPNWRYPVKWKIKGQTVSRFEPEPVAKVVRGEEMRRFTRQCGKVTACLKL